MSSRLLIILAFFLQVHAAPCQPFALVIGAGDYLHLRPLDRANADAKAMADVLKANGFEVTLLLNPKNTLQLDSAVVKFLRQLNDHPESTGLIYFSGHGIQVDSVNFLIPTDANPATVTDIPTSCLSVKHLFEHLQKLSNRLILVILDSCHDNSLSSEFNMPPGLHEMYPPKNTIVATSAMPNRITYENRYTKLPSTATAISVGRLDKNHSFSRKLTETLQKKNVSGFGVDHDETRKLLNRVSNMVSLNTNGLETPWISAVYEEPVVIPPVPEIIVIPKPDVFDSTKVPLTYLQRLAKTNLDTRTFANGDPIPQARTEAEWAHASRAKLPAWTYFDNDSTTNATHGKLYNYYAATDPRGFAEGWNVPTKEDWSGLWKELELPSDSNHFVATPTGFREPDGKFKRRGKTAGWWTRSEYSASHTYTTLTMVPEKTRSLLVVNKGAGYSIRLIKSPGYSIKITKR